jgi:hypothetical protein
MKTDETIELLERWHVLQGEPVHPTSGDVTAVRSRLVERVNILHRLNELGEYTVDDIPIVRALEETNILLRQLDEPGHSEPAPVL